MNVLLLSLLPLQRDAGLRGILSLPLNFSREPVGLVSFLPPHQWRHLDSRACAASLSVISQHRLSDCPVASTSSSLHCLRDRVRVGETKKGNE